MPTPNTRPRADLALERIEALRAEVSALTTRVLTLEQKIAMFADLPEEIESLGEITDRLVKTLDGVNPTSLGEQIDRVILLIDGDPSKDVVGLRTRVRTIEAQTTQIVEERNRIKWVLIGLSLTGIANLASIFTVIAKALGAG